jgi:glycosyltransferase involved in cell wall biosynthesis
MEKGLLSIVMVSYNHAQYLPEAIESVIVQTYKDWELIIVDDGSEDASFETAQTFALQFPGRIKLYSHEGRRNLGIIASYAVGISRCQGEYLGFLEPDDIWELENAEIKIRALREQDITFVYSDCTAIGDPDVISMRRLTLGNFSSVPAGVAFEAFQPILVDNFVPSFSCAVVKVEVFRGLKFITDKKYSVWLDWFLWIQISLKTRFLFIPEKLVRWRLHRQSYGNTFFIRGGIFRRIGFEFRYRWMVFKNIIMDRPGNFREKLVLAGVSTAAFLKKIVLFIGNRILRRSPIGLF